MENSSTPSVMVWSAVRVLLVALIFIAPVFVGFSILFWLWIVVSSIRQAMLYWLRKCYNYGLLLFKTPFYYIVAGDLYPHHRSLFFLRFVLAVCKIFICLRNITRFTRSCYVIPACFPTLTFRNQMINRKIFFLKYVRTILTSVHVP